MKLRLHFVTTGSPVSKIIRWATASPISHVELCIDELTPAGLLARHGFLSDTRGYLGALGRGGVKIRDPHYDKWTFEAILETDEIPYDVGRRIWEFAFAQLDKPYDWKALIGMALGQDWRDPVGEFCSEVTIAAFDAGPFLLLEDWGRPWRITPGMLFDSPRLHPVFLAIGGRQVTRLDVGHQG